MKRMKKAKNVMALVLCFSLLFGLTAGLQGSAKADSAASNGKAGSIVSDETKISFMSSTDEAAPDAQPYNDYLTNVKVGLLTEDGVDITTGAIASGTKVNLNIEFQPDDDAIRSAPQGTPFYFALGTGTMPGFEGSGIPTKENPDFARPDGGNQDVFMWWKDGSKIYVVFTDDYYNNPALTYKDAFVSLGGTLTFSGSSDNKKLEYDIMGQHFSVHVTPVGSILKSAGELSYSSELGAYVVQYTLDITTDAVFPNGFSILDNRGNWINAPVTGNDAYPILFDSKPIQTAPTTQGNQTRFTVTDSVAKGDHTLTYYATVSEEMGLGSHTDNDSNARNEAELFRNDGENKYTSLGRDDAYVNYATSLNIQKANGGIVRAEDGSYYVDYVITVTLDRPVTSFEVTDKCPKNIKPISPTNFTVTGPDGSRAVISGTVAATAGDGTTTSTLTVTSAAGSRGELLDKAADYATITAGSDLHNYSIGLAADTGRETLMVYVPDEKAVVLCYDVKLTAPHLYQCRHRGKQHQLGRCEELHQPSGSCSGGQLVLRHAL